MGMELTEPRPRNKSGFYRQLALAGVLGPIIFWLISFVLASLQPGYSSIRQTLSALVLTPHGWLQTLDFCLFGYLVMLFALGLYTGVQKKRGFKISIFLLFLLGCGMVIIGIFPTDPAGSTSIHGYIHHYTVYALGVLYPISCFLMYPSLKVDDRWENLAVYTVISGAMILYLIIVWIVMQTAGWMDAWVGLYERLFMANAVIWLEVMAVRLLFLPNQLEKTQDEIGLIISRGVSKEFWQRLGLSVWAVSSVWKSQKKEEARSRRMLKASKYLVFSALLTAEVSSLYHQKTASQKGKTEARKPIMSRLLVWGAESLGRRLGLRPVTDLVSTIFKNDEEEKSA